MIIKIYLQPGANVPQAITLDPLRLLDEIRAVQQQLAGLAAGAVPILMASSTSSSRACLARRRSGPHPPQGSQPDRTASELLVRLQTQEPEGYPAALLRTLQRRVKVWRRAEAMKLVFTADITTMN